mmetsp:Transcript_56573/g.131855  ORF Transcript_56573/g.131855 Transcript_56573/m.131855 type:complete len:136 (+) Transcript_56573:1226-1633(+)
MSVAKDPILRWRCKSQLATEAPLVLLAIMSILLSPRSARSVILFPTISIPRLSDIEPVLKKLGGFGKMLGGFSPEEGLSTRIQVTGKGGGSGVREGSFGTASEAPQSDPKLSLARDKPMFSLPRLNAYVLCMLAM